MTEGIVKLTESQLADPQEVGIRRGPERYILCPDSEIECQPDSARPPYSANMQTNSLR